MSQSRDIWQHDSEGLDPSKLQDYLEGRLSPEEQREVEEWLSEEGLESEAVEGLRQMVPQEAKDSVNRINQQLQKQLFARDRKKTRPMGQQYTAVIAVFVVLLLAVLAYVVLHFLLRK